MTIRTRTQLLGSAMTAVACAIVATGFATPASAQCAIGTTITANDTINCGPTTTTDTTYGLPTTLGTERYYPSTGGLPAFVNVNGLVNGYGLAISNDSTLTAVNSGGVTADAGTPTAGGSGALYLSGTEVLYSGNGDITNNFDGPGLNIQSNDTDGGVAVNAQIGGSVTAANGTAIQVDQTNVAGGDVNVSTNIGETITASNGNGIQVTSNGTGQINVTNFSDILEGAGGGLANGIYVNHGGSGNVIVGNIANIGTSADRADYGIDASISVPGTAGNIDVTNGGAIFADVTGIEASTAGTGNVNVTSTVSIDSAGRGIVADTTTGDLLASLNGSVTTAGDSVDLGTTGGNITLQGTANITSNGGAGVIAASNGGDIAFNYTGPISASDSAVSFNSLGGDVSGSLTGNLNSVNFSGLYGVSGGGGIDLTLGGATSAQNAVWLDSSGGDLTLVTNGVISSSGDRGIQLSSGSGALNLTTNASVSGASNGIETQSTTGNQTLDINGAVSGAGGGLQVTALGGGTVGGDISGSVTSSGGNGITVNTDTGSQNLTIGGAVNAQLEGIAQSSTTGNITTTVTGDVSAATGGYGIIASTGSGAIDYTVGGDVTASGAASQGVLVQSTGGAGSGNLKLTTLAGSTIEARNVGVHVENYNAGGTGTVTVINGADIIPVTAGTLGTGILATNQGLGSVTVDNSGNIGSSTSRLGAEGIWGYVFNAGSSAPLVITNGAGSIYANNGISAVNVGTGTTSVTTGTGRVDGTLAGIAASGGAGLMTITTGSGLVTGGTNGISAVSTGIQDINVNGAVSGTGAGSVGLLSNTSGARTIDIASGASVTGTASAIDLVGSGNTTITNDGSLSGPFLVRNTGTGSVNLTNASGATLAGAAAFSDAADIIDNSGSYTFTGATNLAGGVDQVINRSGGTMTVNGSIDFGAGVDSMTNEAGGTLNTVTGSSIANLETLGNAGTANVAGTLAFSGVPTALSNTGTLNLTGATVTGLGTVDNSAAGAITTTGTSSLSATGAITNAGSITAGGPLAITTTAAFNNSGTVNGMAAPVTVTTTSFNNTGSINLQDNATGDTFTINGNYDGGAGARLLVDASDTLADQLVVNGNISGTTAVDANLIGTGALIDGGLLVVDGNGTSTANAFVLGNLTGTAGPLATYNVTQVGSDYYLNAALSEAGLEPLTLGAIIPDLWYPSADEVIANLAVPYKGEGLGIWAQGYASRDKFGDSDRSVTIAGTDYSLNERTKVGRLGVQAGVDFGMGGTGRVGVTGGFGTQRFKGLTEIDADGWNIGAYGSFGGETGFHGEALVKHDRNRLKFREGALDDESIKVRSTGVDGSVGYRIPMGGENSSIDLAVGASHVWNKVEDLDTNGLSYRYDDYDSTRGRASARWNLGGDIQPYVQGTVYHEFADGGSVTLNDGVNDFMVDANRRGTWGRIEAGVGGSPGRFPTFAAWADVGDVKGIGARLGFRFGGGREVAPPPPAVIPAPPAEPAPATQTCYDGSVILATDSCPLPPPPPPPAATPERG